MKHCDGVAPWETPCVLPDTPEHAYHLDEAGKDWPNAAVVRPYSRREDGRPIDRARQIAAQARKATTATFATPRARTAVVGPLQPDDATAQRRVLDYLVMRRGEWVDGWRLTDPEVGGAHGAQRVRDLRAERDDIEQRSKPDVYPPQWQYRIL
jgi:hypothetical protein